MCMGLMGLDRNHMMCVGVFDVMYTAQCSRETDCLFQCFRRSSLLADSVCLSDVSRDSQWFFYLACLLIPLKVCD